MSAPRICVAMLAISITHGVSSAGELTPPGAPAPTMKTLDEIEPGVPIGPLTTPGDADSVFRINGAGRHFLTADVEVPAGMTGIEVAGADCTIDLNGFRIVDLGGAGAAIRTPDPRSNIIVRDGTVVGTDGVAMANTNRVVIERVAVFGAEDPVIDVGVGAVVRDCYLSGSPGDGVAAGGQSVIEANVILDCVGIGVVVEDDCVVRDNRITRCDIGVFPNSAGARVEGNTISACDTGVFVNGAYTLVRRNIFHGVGASIIDGSFANFIGPIVTPGNAASNTNPDANYAP